MSALLVELLGLPGSGKSALARETCRALQSGGHRAEVLDRPISAAVPKGQRVRRRTAGAARTALRRPAWTVTSAALMAGIDQPARRDTAAALTQWLAVCDLASRARARPGVHLLEEGPCQTLWTLLLRSGDALPEELLDSWPRAAAADVVVVLDVPLAVVAARLQRRGSKHSRSQHLQGQALTEELRRGQRLLEALAARVDVPVLRLAGGDDTTAVALGRQLTGVLVAHPAAGAP